MNTLARIVRRLSAPHFSSTPPEEKKNTSYGRHRRAEERDGVEPVGRWRPRSGTAGCVASVTSAPQSGPSFHTATAKTISASPASPKAFSSTANRTRQSTTHTSTPTTGTHSR